MIIRTPPPVLPLSGQGSLTHSPARFPNVEGHLVMFQSASLQAQPGLVHELKASKMQDTKRKKNFEFNLHIYLSVFQSIFTEQGSSFSVNQIHKLITSNYLNHLENIGKCQSLANDFTYPSCSNFLPHYTVELLSSKMETKGKILILYPHYDHFIKR